MLGLIPTSIVIGIIEDKIANIGDSKTKEHLKDIKAKIKKESWKEIKQTIEVNFTSGKLERFTVDKYELINGFLVITDDNRKKFFNTRYIAGLQEIKQ